MTAVLLDSTPSLGDRVSGATRTWWARLVLGLLLVGTVVRLLLSGPLVYLQIPPNVLNLKPQFELIVDHIPVTTLPPRSYGVVAWLMFDPIVRIFGKNALALNLWALFLSLSALALAFALMAARLRVRRPRSLIALVVLWTGFLPIVMAVAERMFDLLLLASLAIAFFLYTGTARQRAWSGVAIAAGTLTKFLPGIFIPFFIVREKRAFAYCIVAIAGLLLVGQILYGDQMGFGYLYAVGVPTASAVDDPLDFSSWHEGFGPRQLLFKIAAGYHLHNAFVEPPNPQLLSNIGYVVEVGFLLYMLYVVFRYRASDGLERRAIEFALGVVTLYMVAPTIGHEHLPSMILVYTILAWYWLRSPTTPPRSLITLAVASLALTGVYLPMQIVGKVLPLDAVMRALGNESTPIFGIPIGEYDFLGFPGYGAILAWVVVVMVERRTRTQTASPSR